MDAQTQRDSASALLIAGLSSHCLERMQAAIDAGADPDFSDGWPLALSCATHQHQATDLLIRCGARLESSGPRALSVAIQAGNQEDAELLIALGVSVKDGGAPVAKTERQIAGPSVRRPGPRM